MIARLVHFEGMVQGVGFRYTARECSRRFSVAGFVRNLPDGRVELWAEGEPAEVGGFLRELREAMTGHIRSETSRDEAAQGWADFTIRA